MTFYHFVAGEGHPHTKDRLHLINKMSGTSGLREIFNFRPQEILLSRLTDSNINLKIVIAA